MSSEKMNWENAIHISRWYVSKHCRQLSCIVGGDDIVSEAMAMILKSDADKLEGLSLTTIVCNCTRWAAIQLYREHKKQQDIKENIDCTTDHYVTDFTEDIQTEDLQHVITRAKNKLIDGMQKSLGEKPSKPAEIAHWEFDNRHTLTRIKRYSSGFFEEKIVNEQTLEQLASNFGVTKERARQLEGKFLRLLKQTISDHYKLSPSQAGDLLLVGEVVTRSN